MRNGELLKPLFKYPGGKSAEYKHLKNFFPKFTNYVEPFLGGGAVYWATEAEKWTINDYSNELMSIYIYTKEQNQLFLNYVHDIACVWENKNLYAHEIENILKESLLIDKLAPIKIDEPIYDGVEWLKDRSAILNNEIIKSIERKIKSLKRVSTNSQIKNLDDNALGILGSAVYTDLRSIYNATAFSASPQLKTALYLYLREYAYSSMFRYNASGEFNVPFGGNTYAKKNFSYRYQQITSKPVVNKLKHTDLLVGDFSKSMPDNRDTFIFLDPPYDSEFSTYNLHVFDAMEQRRLHDFLINIKDSKWLMVIKATPFIEDLYSDKSLFLNKFSKNYSVNFKNRNEQDVEHLLITNYSLGE